LQWLHCVQWSQTLSSQLQVGGNECPLARWITYLLSLGYQDVTNKFQGIEYYKCPCQTITSTYYLAIPSWLLSYCTWYHGWSLLMMLEERQKTASLQAIECYVATPMW